MGLTFNLGRVSPSVFTDSSLNVGIGAAPSGSYKLEVTGTAKVSSTLLLGGALTGTSATFSDRLNVTKAVSENIIIANYDTNNRMEMSANGFNLVGGNPFYIRQASGANQLTITTGGNVGIGGTPENKFNVFAGTGATFRATANGTNVLNIGNYSSASGFRELQIAASELSFSTGTAGAGSTTERMRITSNGTVGIGITTGTYNGRFCIEGDGATTSNVHLEMSTDANRSYLQSANRTFIANAPLTIGCSSIIIEALAGSGSRTVTASADGTLSASSDSTLKQEDKEYKIQGLAEILQLKPRAYKWLSDIEIRAEEATTEIGFFADEVNPIIPSAAPKGNDNLYGFYDRAVIAALVKAIQEQNQMITSLQDRLDKAGL
jgi:hypothetical protein